MGEKLVQFYKEAEQLGGIRAKIKLASQTRIPSTEAAAIADTPENITAFKLAMAGLAREFLPAGAGPSIHKVMAGEAPEATVQRLRRNAQAFADLMSQRAVFLGDIDTTNARITEAITGAIQVQRASVWFYDEQRTLIRCADLFDTSTGEHTKGVELFAKDFPPYFAALEHERTIAAHDAHTDPRTAVFSEPYLKPLGINSMLDVPIWTDGRMVGVVCHEHVGPARNWIADEENFAFLMANFVALALENQRRPRVR